MNSLVDPEMIRALYRASHAGVKIDLIVRGMCCLKPGIKGISENINVISIVGRFLEHSRIYYFYNGGNEEIYMGSADLMQRNLDRRVEILFPIEDKLIKKEIVEDILSLYLKDTVKARRLLSDGSYVPVFRKENTEPLNSQLWFISKKTSNPKNVRKPGKNKKSA